MNKIVNKPPANKPSSAIAIVAVACIATVACASFVWMALVSSAWWRNTSFDAGKGGSSHG